VDDFEKIVADYTKDYETLQQDQKNFEEDYKYWKACLANILPDWAPREIAVKAGDLKQEIKALKEDIPALERELPKLKLKRDDKEKYRNAQKEILETWKKPSASIKTRLGLLKSLDGDVKTAHDGKEFAYAYWILTDDEKFEGKLGGQPAALSPEDLRVRLEDTWKLYRSAIAQYNDADGNVKSTEKKIETKKARLDEATKKLEATLRSELSKIKPK
jgi:chromosome segregation ATPase